MASLPKSSIFKPGCLVKSLCIVFSLPLNLYIIDYRSGFKTAWNHNNHLLLNGIQNQANIPASTVV